MKRDLASIGLGLAIGLIAVALVSLCGCARPNLLHPGILDPKHPDLHVSVTDDLYLHQPLQPEELELTVSGSLLSLVAWADCISAAGH